MRGGSQADERRSEGNTGCTSTSFDTFYQHQLPAFTSHLPPSFLHRLLVVVLGATFGLKFLDITVSDFPAPKGRYVSAHNRRSLVLFPCSLVDGLICCSSLPLSQSFFSVLRTIRPRRCLTIFQSRRGC